MTNDERNAVTNDGLTGAKEVRRKTEDVELQNPTPQPPPQGDGGADCSRCGAVGSEPCRDRNGSVRATPHSARARKRADANSGSMTFNDRLRDWANRAHEKHPEFSANFLAWGFVSLRNREHPCVDPSLAEVRSWCEGKARELTKGEAA